MRENYTLKRLYIGASLEEGGKVSLPKEHIHYLANVLRMKPDQELRVFNGRDGEWLAVIETLSKKQSVLRITQHLRAPATMPDVHLAFAPVRRHRTTFIIEKATELGVATLEPVVTERTQFPKINVEKVRVQSIEAAEQTERLDIPTIKPPQKLLEWLGTQSERTILFADEVEDTEVAVKSIEKTIGPVTLLIGPEGGFSDFERSQLRAGENVVPVSLGPRILRADTAALALLTLWQAMKGDWS